MMVWAIMSALVINYYIYICFQNKMQIYKYKPEKPKITAMVIVDD